MTELVPNNADGEYKIGTAGNVLFLAELLYSEYSMIGYSIMVEDIAIAIKNDFLFYAGWQETTSQRNKVTSTISDVYEMSIDEWAVIEPVVRAHCDFMQANRVEGTESLGGTRFGLTVSEASSNYSLAKEKMTKDAFFEDPFTL